MNLDPVPYVDPNPLRNRNIGDIIGNSTGGAVAGPAILDRPGWQGAYVGSSIDRAPGNTNDSLITRTRNYLYRRAYYIPPATGSAEFNQTLSGAVRDIPTTRFNRNVRPIVGGSNQNMEGMHTYYPTGQQAGNKLAGKTRMRPGKQNTLTVQRYRGQSYSETTVVAH
jgi:hypothetical protein